MVHQHLLARKNHGNQLQKTNYSPLRQPNLSLISSNKISQNIELIGHPPYSPYLASSDFSLYQKIKSKLRSQRFSTPEEAVDALKLHILEVPESESTIGSNEEYIEKQ